LKFGNFVESKLSNELKIKMLKGILFDMDGVLVDSEKYIFEAAK